MGALVLLFYYALLSFNRLEVFKMLLTSFFPLLILILAVLGSIVMGLATPTEAAAVGAFGGFVLAVACGGGGTAWKRSTLKFARWKRRIISVALSRVVNMVPFSA